MLGTGHDRAYHNYIMQFVDKDAIVAARVSELTGRLAALREALLEGGFDGLVIPRFDPYQGEVVAPHDERLAYLTGFTGSAGIAVVTDNRAVLFVDGRYQVQVKNEVDTEAYEIAHFYDEPIETWLRHNAGVATRFAINSGLVPRALYDRIDAALTAAGSTLVAVEQDLIDRIWVDQPPAPTGAIFSFPLSIAGEASLDKRKRLSARLVAAGVDILAETQPDNIAWLLNIRGSDIAHTPLPHSTLILDQAGRVDWFVDRRKLPNDMPDLDIEGLAVHDVSNFLPALEHVAKDQKVGIDREFAPVAVRMAVQRGGGRPVEQSSVITQAKAVKNEVELDGFRAVHVDDGVALTEFMAWLDAEVVERKATGNPITELEAQSVLGDLRRRGADFREESFATISAAGSNAAMCHYSSKPSTNAALNSELPYLVDSGGQYLRGTTDVTRTLAFGPMPRRVVRAYTAVVKGFIALASARFPRSACGHHLDALARRPLWDLGLDYDHGTGHGVGHYLSVHEHPHRFSKMVSSYRFEPGVVMTIEPGYYAEGDFGLRVENQVEVIDAGGGFLAFRSLTLAPVDLSLADKAMFTDDEIAWIDTYHQGVWSQLESRLSMRGRAYLARMTTRCS